MLPGEQEELVLGTQPLGDEGAKQEESAVTPPEATQTATPDPELVALRQQVAQKTAELEGMRAESEQLRVWKQERDFEPHVEAYVQRLINEQNLDERAARMVANAEKKAYLADMSRQGADVAARSQAQGWVAEALDLAEKHGISAKELLKLPRDQMRIQAGLLGEIAQLKKQVQKTVREQVPPQEFESGQAGGRGGTSHAAYLQSLKEGKPLPAADEIDRIVAQAMRQG